MDGACFTDHDARALTAFLSDPSRPAGCPSYPRLAGFLFAIANGPEPVHPETWLARILGPAGSRSRRSGEALGAKKLALALHDATVVEDPFLARLPLGCALLTDPLANFEPESLAAQWATGFFEGYVGVKKHWDSVVHGEALNDLAFFVVTLSYFRSRREAERMANRARGPFRSLKTHAQAHRDLMPGASAQYAEMGGLVRWVWQTQGDVWLPI